MLSPLPSGLQLQSLHGFPGASGTSAAVCSACFPLEALCILYALLSGACLPVLFGMFRMVDWLFTLLSML